MSAARDVVRIGVAAERTLLTAFATPHDRSAPDAKGRTWCLRSCRRCRLDARVRLLTRVETSLRFLVREGKAV